MSKSDQEKIYIELQKKWIELVDLKVGDQVKVLRGFENNELGCGIDKGDSDEIIGDILKVRRINYTNINIIDEFGNWWEFPFFCLEKVESKQIESKQIEQIETESIPISSDYTFQIDLGFEVDKKYLCKFKKGTKIKTPNNAIYTITNIIPNQSSTGTQDENVVFLKTRLLSGTDKNYNVGTELQIVKEYYYITYIGGSKNFINEIIDMHPFDWFMENRINSFIDDIISLIQTTPITIEQYNKYQELLEENKD